MVLYSVRARTGEHETSPQQQQQQKKKNKYLSGHLSFLMIFFSLKEKNGAR